MKLYLGCGPAGLHEQHKKVMGDPDEWTFVDYYVRGPNIKNWDARTLEEVKDGSVEKIYNSHLMEHFSHREMLHILSIWYMKLMEGGEIIINVPDLEWACRKFLEILEQERAGDPPSKEYYRSTINYTDYEHDFLQIFYGSHAHDGEHHKCGFTKESLIWLLETTGFKNIQVEQIFEGHDIGCLIARGTK